MTSCIVEQRRAVEAAAGDVDADPRVGAVDVIGPAVGPRDAWVLDVVCADPGRTPLSVQHRQVLAVVAVG
jgi:hypothetical protein